MKFKFLSVMIFTFFLSASMAQAVEQVAVEPALSQEMRSSDTFRAVVTGDGKLILKPGTVFTEGGNYAGMQLPYLISHPKPINYPRWAIRQGWQGDFNIAIEVLKTGKVGRYKVMKSTGHTVLDQAATEAVQSWTFYPAVKNGQFVVTCIQIPVRFQLDSQE